MAPGSRKSAFSHRAKHPLPQEPLRRADPRGRSTPQGPCCQKDGMKARSRSLWRASRVCDSHPLGGASAHTDTPRGDGHLKASAQGGPAALRLHGDRAHTGAAPHLPTGEAFSAARGPTWGRRTRSCRRVLCSHTAGFVSAAKPFTSHIFSNLQMLSCAWDDTPHIRRPVFGADSPCGAFPCSTAALLENGFVTSASAFSR